VAVAASRHLLSLQVPVLQVSLNSHQEDGGLTMPVSRSCVYKTDLPLAQAIDPCYIDLRIGSLGT